MIKYTAMTQIDSRLPDETALEPQLLTVLEADSLSAKRMAAAVVGICDPSDYPMEETIVIDPDDEERAALNERLRAERIAIKAVLVEKLADSLLDSSAEHIRPRFKEDISPPADTASYDEAPWRYTISRAPKPRTRYSDFEFQAKVVLTRRQRAWAEQELSQEDSQVAQFTARLQTVIDQQAALGVSEGRRQDGADLSTILHSDQEAEELLINLPLENIPDIQGNFVAMALYIFSNDPHYRSFTMSQRLKVLDDLVDQAAGISHHHLAHFDLETDDVSGENDLLERNVRLVQDGHGKYRLDWDGRVTKKPAAYINSRTQGCSADFVLSDGRQSALRRLGRAYNTAVYETGLLEPGTAYDVLTPPRIVLGLL